MENGNYYIILGLYWGNGKENGNHLRATALVLGTGRNFIDRIPANFLGFSKKENLRDACRYCEKVIGPPSRLCRDDVEAIPKSLPCKDANGLRVHK